MMRLRVWNSERPVNLIPRHLLSFIKSFTLVSCSGIIQILSQQFLFSDGKLMIAMVTSYYTGMPKTGSRVGIKIKVWQNKIS